MRDSAGWIRSWSTSNSSLDPIATNSSPSSTHRSGSCSRIAVDHLGEVARQRLGVARGQLHLVTVLEDQASEPVPLGLEREPTVELRRVGDPLHRLGEHRLDGRHHRQVHEIDRRPTGVTRPPRGAHATPQRGQITFTLSLCERDGLAEHLPHVVGLVHHVLPRESEHDPSVDHHEVVSAGVAAQGTPVAVPRERVGLQDDAELHVDEVGTYAVGHVALRLHVQPGDLERDRSQGRLERVVRQAVGLSADPADLRRARSSDGGADPPQDTRRHTVSQRRVSNCQCLVERHRAEALQQRVLGRGDDAMHLVGLEVCPVQDHASLPVGRDATLRRHRDVRPIGNLLQLPTPVQSGAGVAEYAGQCMCCADGLVCLGSASRPRPTRTTSPTRTALSTCAREVSRSKVARFATPPSSIRHSTTDTRRGCRK